MNIQQILKAPQLDVNLTGQQITEVLNCLLYLALQPIFISTNLGRICCSEILTKSHDDHRRKISILDKQQITDTLYNVIINKPKDSWEYFKLSKLERSISSKILNLFLDLCKDYKKDELNYCKYRYSLLEYEELFNCSYSILGCIISNATFYSNLYYTFKHKIMQKYYLLAWKKVCKKTKVSGTFIDVHDLFKTFTIAIDKAIDKYSEEKGTLLSFILWQFKEALINPIDEYEYGQSYVIPRYMKLKLTKEKDELSPVNSFSLSIDDFVENTIPIEENINIIDKISSDKLISIINNTPGTEVASLMLGIAKNKLVNV